MFQLTGRGHAPASLSNATLLIIDAQEEYRSGALRLPGLDAAAAEIGVLVQAARASGTPIVHVDVYKRQSAYNDPNLPLARQLVEAVSRFILRGAEAEKGR